MDRRTCLVPLTSHKLLPPLPPHAPALLVLCLQAGGQVVEDGKRFNMVRSVAAQPVLIQLPVE